MSCKRGRKVVRSEKRKCQDKEGFPGNISKVLDMEWSTWLRRGDVHAEHQTLLHPRSECGF